MSKQEDELYIDGIVPERPPSLDESGRRLFIFPAKAKGFFRSYRNIVYTFLIGFFLVLPWTTFRGEQTILLDISRRKFVFFAQTFFAHDTPLLFFVLAITVFGIFLATAVWGRVWCGWACPQTVFIDAIFRKIEEWIEGNHLQRRKLQSSPWTKSKVFKKSIKWTLYFLISSHIAHSFTAYFVGAKNLIGITLHTPATNWGLFVFVQLLTLAAVVNFGWFREQFCLIVCPYGRFQSVLMDQHSLAVLYDSSRGEPRRQKGKANSGDCIDCHRCTAVCPTGIDIRDGLQMECIACTACIDACDEVMTKTNKPKGLIRYASESQMRGRQRRWLNGRTASYTVFILVLCAGLIYSVSHRSTIDAKVVRAIESPYSVLGEQPNQYVINHFRLHVTNQSRKPISLQSLVIDAPEIEVISPQLVQEIPGDKNAWIHFFVKFPIAVAEKSGKRNVEWTLNYNEEGALAPGFFKNKIVLLAPNLPKKPTSH